MHHISQVLNDDSVGELVSVRGWVYRIRTSGKISFIVLRDSTGLIQCVASSDSLSREEFEKLSSLTVESSVMLTGKVKKDSRAVTGYELEISSSLIYQRNQMFPITKDKGEEFLLDNRHLWLRSREFSSVLRIRATLFKSFRDYLDENEYYEVQGPMMVSTATEGGSTLFKVPFFEDVVSLTQSSQFYLETMIFSLEKVYTIAPSFRAEKSRTRRHLTEYWHAEGEAAWFSNEDMMKEEERMIEYMVKQVLERNHDDLITLGRDISKLESVKAPFPRFKYSEIIKKSSEFGLSLKYGDDFGADEERAITMNFDRPIFVTHYPLELKAFYHRPDPDSPGEALCHDLLAPEGIGEIIGGGERIWELDVLEERMKNASLNPQDYYWYVDLRKYGSVPHSGFGLGLDRMAWWITKRDTIRDAIPFPRTVRRIRP